MAKTLTNLKVYVCAAPQNTDLDQAGFEALTWVKVGNVGSVGETGSKTNLVSYDELETDVTQKAKGITDAGSPEIECARNATDAGQIILRTVGAHNDANNYAYKWTKVDGTVHYYRGVCTGPTRPNGRNEDFDLEVFTLGLNQAELTVNP